ncbi:hypothetical protein MLD38_032980 [Melastoma candidum]|uniref:Uncharacterized protein n=1 Tax=Melastoma candidum TaxID=119954 RepID=A0ACB9M5C7_9MYRT|nr:hypothetical protein MLD38_032980 [Melastoma candidum]
MGVARTANSSGSEVLPRKDVGIDERKRKRMESNRESARRSRLRKQKQLDDLLGQVSHLECAIKQLVDSIDAVQKKYSVVEADNSVLRVQIAELTGWLQSLNSVLEVVEEVNGIKLDIPEVPDMVMRPWQQPCPVQPIATASVEPFWC